jgi:Zn finger protein HypA/HybF involved in hydrogenase expression
MIIRCHHCSHEWDYKGKSNKYVTCPVCHYKVNVSKSLTDMDLNISYNKLINRLSKIENALTNLQNSLVLNTPAFHSDKLKSSPGVLIKCSKCGYQWYFKGLKHIARCPECNARVNVQDSKVKS